MKSIIKFIVKFIEFFALSCLLLFVCLYIDAFFTGYEEVSSPKLDIMMWISVGISALLVFARSYLSKVFHLIKPDINPNLRDKDNYNKVTANDWKQQQIVTKVTTNPSIPTTPNKPIEEQIKCFQCKATYSKESLYCPICNSPSPKIYEQISSIVTTFGDRIVSYQLDKDFDSQIGYSYFVYCELPKIRELCNLSQYLSDGLKARLKRDISNRCSTNLKRLYEADDVYKDAQKEYDKSYKYLKKQYQNGKIAKSTFDISIGKLDNGIHNLFKENLDENFPNQILDATERIAYSQRIVFEDVYKEEEQLSIRDLIESESKLVNKKLNELHNSIILQQKEYYRFEEQVNSYNKIFNETTIDFVNNILTGMRRKAKITTQANADDISSYDEIDGLDGWAFEEWCANVLRANGFINVEVTQKSGDNGADVLAEKDDITYSIQCKKYSGQVGVSAIQEVNTSKGMYNRDIAVVMTNSTFTPQAIKLAQSVNVKLWGADRVREMAEKLDVNN